MIHTMHTCNEFEDSDFMSTCRPISEAETACQKWEGLAFIKLRVIIIYMDTSGIGYSYLIHFHDNLQFWGAQPPLSKSGGGGGGGGGA